MKKLYQFVLDGTGSGQCIAIVADTWWHWAFISEKKCTFGRVLPTPI